MKSIIMRVAPVLLAMFGIVATAAKWATSAFLLEQPVCPEELLK